MLEPSVEEYKELRNEITFLAASIGKFYISSLTASVTLLAGLGAFLLGNESGVSKLNEVTPYFFLAPPLIVISVLYLLAAHRKDLHRAGSYLQVFHEDAELSPRWECRLEQFRGLGTRNESLDAIPWSFWAIQLVSTGLYFFALTNAGGIRIQHMLWPLLEVLFLLPAHVCYHNAIKDRQEYYKRWLHVKKQEKL